MDFVNHARKSPPPLFLAEYAAWARSRWLKVPDFTNLKDISVMVMGLVGEAAELSLVSEHDTANLALELGDCGYYAVLLATTFNLDLAGCVQPYRLVEPKPLRCNRPLSELTLKLLQTGGKICEVIKKAIRDGIADDCAYRAMRQALQGFLREYWNHWHEIVELTNFSGLQALARNHEKVERRIAAGTLQGHGSLR